MQTTLTIDDDVFAAARRVADVSGEEIDAVVSDLMRKGLGDRVKLAAPPPQGDKPFKFPVFEVPPGTPMITLKMVQDALDEELY